MKKGSQLATSCIILLVVLYGCETWYMTLWEGQRLRVFKNRVLRRYLDQGEVKRQEIRENYIISSFMTVIFAKYN
jgi:hypothetical protein